MLHSTRIYTDFILKTTDVIVLNVTHTLLQLPPTFTYYLASSSCALPDICRRVSFTGFGL